MRIVKGILFRSLITLTTILTLIVLLHSDQNICVQAATLTVTNENDSGPGSLRETLANARIATQDVVNFAPGVNRITLTSGEIQVIPGIRIAGPGANILTISGNNTSRIFYIANVPLLGPTISGITFTDGYALNGDGGAILAEGNWVNIYNCVIRNSYARDGGGIALKYPFPSSIRNSQIYGNRAANAGGGIIAYINSSWYGVPAISNVAIHDNYSGNVGGGIYFATNAHRVFGGNDSIEKLTIYNNESKNKGGGAYIDSVGGRVRMFDSSIYNNRSEAGGGIYATGGYDIHIGNSTISGNISTKSAGGIVAASAIFDMDNCTVAYNEGPVGGLDVLTPKRAFVSNTIIANNKNLQLGDVSGPINSQGFNLFRDTTGVTTPLDMTDLKNVNPLLGPLQNNGGPTPTHALLSGSPAIDAGEDSEDVDQRGVARGGFNSDIGAYEFQPVSQTIFVRNGNDSGPDSFREAVNKSNPGDTIIFKQGFSKVTLNSPITFTKDLIINGPGVNSLSIQSAPGFPTFIVDAGVKVRISGMTWRNSGIENHGDLFLSNIVTSRQPASPYNEALIVSDTGSIKIDRSTIADSQSTQHSGGISILSGKLIMNNSIVKNNQVVVNNSLPGVAGGGIYLYGFGRIKGSTISENTSSIYPSTFFVFAGVGGIYVAGGTLTLINTTIDGNRSYLSGYGGLYAIVGSTVSMVNCTVTRNISSDTLGIGSTSGIYSNNNVYLKNTLISGNYLSDVSGQVNSGGHNLIGNVGNSTGYTSSDLLNVNPLILSLADNGGLTPTVALQQNSPAIDAGDDYLAPKTDQRGFLRGYTGQPTPLIKPVDIGAFEY